VTIASLDRIILFEAGCQLKYVDGSKPIDRLIRFKVQRTLLVRRRKRIQIGFDESVTDCI
jgi:hypothetical protein